MAHGAVMGAGQVGVGDSKSMLESALRDRQYVIGKPRKGTSEPVYERNGMNALGISRLKAEH
jgi:hypothetical protein